MKKNHNFSNNSSAWRAVIVFTLFTFLQHKAMAQLPTTYTPTWAISSSCNTAMPTLEQVLIDACGVEGKSEFLVFRTGSSAFSPSSLSLQGSSFTNGTTYALASNFVNSPVLATALNSYVGTCATTTFVAATGTIPPNAKVIAFPYDWQTITPINFGYTPILTHYCGVEPIYVITGNWTTTAGFYANALTSGGVQVNCNTSNCTRELKVNFGSGCLITATYHRNNLSRIDGCNIQPNNPPNGLAKIDVTGNLCFPIPKLSPACGGVTISATVSYTAFYAELTASSNSSGLVYEWKDPDDNPISGVGLNTISNIVRPGVYTVSGTDSKGCKVVTTVLVVDKHCR
jgi:hypothetical protein